jgi:hypothetical protein
MVIPSFSCISRVTAWTSSPIRPTGQVEKTEIILGLKSIVGFLDGLPQLFFTAEDDVPSCMSVEKQ